MTFKLCNACGYEGAPLVIRKIKNGDMVEDHFCLNCKNLLWGRSKPLNKNRKV